MTYQRFYVDVRTSFDQMNEQLFIKKQGSPMQSCSSIHILLIDVKTTIKQFIDYVYNYNSLEHAYLWIPARKHSGEEIIHLGCGRTCSLSF